VRQCLAESGRDLAHTSVITVMSIMTRKGYLRRNRQDGSHLYTPILKERSTLGRMLKDLVDRAFGGSASSVMAHLLQTSDLTPQDLKQLRELVARKAREK
jgi:predicted transcriptional regulator